MKISIVHDKRRKTTTGENAEKYPIKIRLTSTREKKTTQKLFPTGYYATEADFKRITNNNTGKRKDLQLIETKVYAMYEHGKGIIKDNPFIDAEAFKNELTGCGNFKDPLSLLEEYIKILKEDGQAGSAKIYNHALVSFRKFDPNISFGSATPKWLMKYEKAMVEEGRSITTVGMYCICLRTIFNLARKKYKISVYPFGKGKYVIPTAKGRNLALTEEQKNQVLTYRTLEEHIQRAVDLWIFSYFCYGMNFADIARLKFGDIKGDVIIFDRTKTINTERNRSYIEIPLRPEVLAIIKKWGNWVDSLNPNAYVFPVLRDGLTPDQIQQKVYNLVVTTNRGLKAACAEGQLNLPVMTTYWARHTFATIAYKKGAGIEFIQMALGHSDPKTTLAYIQSFDIEIKRKVVNWL